MVCDDDSVIRRVVSSMLRQSGHEVVGEAAMAIEALDLVRLHDADLLVLDVSLPGMSGLEITETIQDEQPDTRVVLLSSFEISDEDFKASGAAAAVDKSQLSDLEDVVRKLDPAT